MSFSFFHVDENYCDFLRQTDPTIIQTRKNDGERPFVGIVLTINNINYYAPLASPKEKHKTMKNQVDFIKINNGNYGAINLNNMIPVHTSCVSLVEMKPTQNDSLKKIKYKELLSNQITWCNKNRAVILDKAEKLYALIIRGNAWKELKNRCCDFALAEKQMQEYYETHEV